MIGPSFTNHSPGDASTNKSEIDRVKVEMSISKQQIPRNPHNLTFGADQEFSMQALENPLLIWMLEDLGIHTVQVAHKDGWDYVTFKLHKSVSYHVSDKITAIFEKAEALGVASASDRENFLQGGTRLLLNLVSAVNLSAEVFYRGQILPDNSVVVENLTGIKVRSGPLSVKPLGGVLNSDSSASLDAKVMGVPLPRISAPVPHVFTSAIIDTIRQFEQIRKRCD